jgi:hypothetical protein
MPRPLPSLTVLQRDRPRPLETTIYEPVFCLILQGRKGVTVGDQTLSFGRGEGLLVSHVLPVQSQVTEAPCRALGQLRADLRSRLAVPRLARQVGRSASAFHQHFRAVTGTTPLQYQKELRLAEARRLLRAGSDSDPNFWGALSSANSARS